LTGERVRGAEVIGLALATHFIESKDIDILQSRLTGLEFPENMTTPVRDLLIDEAIEEIECGDSTPEASDGIQTLYSSISLLYLCIYLNFTEFLETVEAIFGAQAKNDTVEGIIERLQVGPNKNIN